MNIFLSKNSKKFIDSQNTTVKKRIENAINKLPEGDVKKLKGEDELFRLRMGDIRIIFSYTKEVIYILKIGYRGDIYKLREETYYDC